MEDALFEWETFDVLDTMEFQWGGVRLKTRIGKHDPGDCFAFASIDYETGTMRLFFEPDDEEPVSEHMLVLEVA